MFRSASANFDRLLEKATSQLLLEPDWSSVMLLCDSVRSGDVAAKHALTSIRRRICNENPHVSMFALQTLESCVKNCGAPFHDELASREFMEELRQLLRQTGDDAIKAKILEMIQNWGNAFKKNSKYGIFNETWKVMRAEGWEFPPLLESSAMFDADVAPEWQEGEVCHHCRIQFGLVTRQHHCRACGQVFCGRCSSKSCFLPKFGIEKEVRVCDHCYDLYAPKEPDGETSPKKKAKEKEEEPLPPEYLASPLSKQSQMPASNGKSEEEVKEEEELQLAIALSKSEEEERQNKKSSKTRSSNSSSNSTNAKEQTSKKEAMVNEDEALSPELMRYLNRDYWEDRERQKSNEEMQAKNTSVVEEVKTVEQVDNAALPQSNTLATTKSAEELDEFVATLRTQVEIFVNRMKSNSSRGRSIANDSSVQTLFMNTMAMHSQLLRNIQEQEDKRVHYEGLQDKLTQVRDARAALDALREEERERKRREAEEAERLRQVQMREKLEVMRQKKQEYLQYQRQLALQRMQEQEREMLFRQQQVKQQYYAAQQPPQSTAPQSMGMYPYQQPPMVYQPQQPYYGQDGTMSMPPMVGQQAFSPQMAQQLPPQQQMYPQQHQQLPPQQQQQQSAPPQQPMSAAGGPPTPQHQQQGAPQNQSMVYNDSNSSLTNFAGPLAAALPSNAPVEKPQVQEAQLISFD